ncbi:MAG: Major phosphate-irrepressible acid phosphatase precursor [Pseudomonadota bacterium]|jgi:acid phosphatase (class A)
MPMPTPFPRAAVAACALALAACASAPPAAAPTVSPEQVGEVRPGSGVLNGYLERKALPNALALLPPPPAEGSPAAAADLAAYRATRALRDTPRWRLATQDAELRFPAAAKTFSCALGLPVSAERTPHLNMLLRRTLADAGLATYSAKDHYNRVRPFVAMKESSCSAAEEPRLVKDGSYPSGHAALGWAWGLVLAQVAPDRTDALAQRGFAFGQSRMICGVHWQSDVDAGRTVGAAAVARLQSDPVFTAQLELARREVAALRAAGATPDGDCAAEATALATR